MRNIKNFIFLLAVGFTFVNAAPALAQPTQVLSAGLGRGINFGQMLEAPYEGAWGLSVEERFFDGVKQAGFDHIRLPVSWTYHTSETAPFTIDPVFFDRIDWCVEQAVSRGIKIIVNVHHYDELNADPVAEQPRFLAIWNQIAQRYSNQPDDAVYFELLNEPHNAFNDNPDLWNQLMPEALSVIRMTNPTRKVIVGPIQWNHYSQLDQFELPDDPNLIATIHFYDPFPFTHQGAAWIDPVLPLGVEFAPHRFNRQPGWQDWSWSTDQRSTAFGIWVEYQSPYAGFSSHNDNGFADAQRLIFSADKELDLILHIKDENGVEGTTFITTEDRFRNYSIPIAPLGVTGKITDITLQNNGNADAPRWNCRNMILVSNSGVWEYVLQKENRAINTAFDIAVTWANENQIPLYLGEYGAFEMADNRSREVWTKTVRVAAQIRNIDWAYWEYAGVFGIFDPVAGEFRTSLIQAMVPQFRDR